MMWTRAPSRCWNTSAAAWKRRSRAPTTATTGTSTRSRPSSTNVSGCAHRPVTATGTPNLAACSASIRFHASRLAWSRNPGPAATSTKARTSSGLAMASAKDRYPPRECPTRTAGAAPAASSTTAARSARAASREYTSAASERPWPRRSQLVTAHPGLRCGRSGNQVAELDPSPWVSSNGAPLPHRSTCSCGPEYALADDVALHLVGAAGDRHRGADQGEELQHPAERGVAAVEHAVGAFDPQTGVAQRAHDRGRHELAGRDLRSRSL